MYCRNAHFIGSVNPDEMDAFRTQIEGPVVEAMLRLPGLKELRIKWGSDFQEGAPRIVLTLEHCYGSKANLEHALASPTRDQVWEVVKIAKSHFDGQVLHINNDVRKFDPVDQ